MTAVTTIIFKCKTLKEWSEKECILEKDEIAIIEYPDNSRKVVIGDGKTNCLDCPELKKFPKSITAEGRKWVSKIELKSVCKINEEGCI